MRVKYFILLFGFLSFVPAAVFSQTTLSGIISDKKSGEAAINVQVLLFRDTIPFPRQQFRHAITNKFGFYSLTNLPEGKYILVARMLGYSIFKEPIRIQAHDEMMRNIELIEDPIQMEEVTVDDSRDLINLPIVSRMEISNEFFQKMPALGGEKDVFRVLQLLPGVKAASEISSGLYIRGGSPDQNLVLLDGVIVYNPFHLGGFLSVFNPDALLNVQLMKGAFPAEYGGRLSSVIEMSMREGTKERISGDGGISLISSRLTVQGPVTDDITFMLSGRRMYLDILTLLAGQSPDAPKYYFYDVNAKMNYRVSPVDRIYASGYYGADVIASSTRSTSSVVDISWRNSTTNLRWMHIFSPKLFSNFSLIRTNFNFSTSIGTSEGDQRFEFSTLSDVRDYVIKGDVQYSADQDHGIKAGIELTDHQFEANAATNLGVDLPANNTLLSALEGAVYAQDDWILSERWRTNVGVRLYYFGGGKYLQPEPRVSLSYSLNEDVALKASYSVAHQFLHLINRNEVLLPTDVWFPSTKTIEPSRSVQYVLGVESSIFGEEYRTSVEAYYKKMTNLYEYKENADFSFGVPLERQFTSGIGTAYGTEWFLQKRSGSFTGWIGYTLSWTKRQFAELNLGRAFYPRYDRRHDISVVLNYRFADNWELGSSWVYGTGQAFTISTGYYLFQPIEPENDLFTGNSWNSFQYISERNNYRAPAYHKLDVGIIWHRRVLGLRSQISFNLYNAYNRQNPLYIYVDTKVDPVTGINKQVLKQVSLFPLIPTLGWSFTF